MFSCTAGLPPLSKPTDIRLLEVESTSTEVAYRTPIKFGGRIVATPSFWKWPSSRNPLRPPGPRAGLDALGQRLGLAHRSVSDDADLAAMAALAERFLAATPGIASGPSAGNHPRVGRRAPNAGPPRSATGWRWPSRFRGWRNWSRPARWKRRFTTLTARHGRNSYDLLGPDYVDADLAALLTREFAGEYLDRYTLRQPKPRMPLYHLVGRARSADRLPTCPPVGDGLPETLAQWIAADGLTHLKIKLNGDDLAWDVERVVAVERVAVEAQAARGCRQWRYRLDFNEKCPHVEYVLDFLAQVRERSPAAFERVQYIEQPTHRDLRANPENRMHGAARSSRW